MPPQPKQVLAVRHGESEWNVLRRRYPADSDRFNPILYTPDCDVTALGKKQSRNAGIDLRDMVAGGNDFTLIVSPLRRALQTAQGMLETCKSTCQPIKTVVHPGAAEVLADPCDIGTNTNELEQEFPDFNFDLLERPHWWAFGQSREDTWERMRNELPMGSETEDMVLERFRKLRNFVTTCKSETVVIVCHSETIWWLTSRVMENGDRLGIWTKNGEVLDISSQLLGVDSGKSSNAACAQQDSRLVPFSSYEAWYGDTAVSAES